MKRKLKPQLKPQLANWDFNHVVEYAEGHILKQFISDGGKGFHLAVWLMLQLAIEWNKLQEGNKTGNK